MRGMKEWYVVAGVVILLALSTQTYGVSDTTAVDVPNLGTSLSLPLSHALEAAGAGAGEGDARGHTQVGLAHLLGLGGDKDTARGVLHLFFGSRGGEASAHAALGFAHRYGLGVPKSCDAAANYYRKAAGVVANTILDSGAEPEVDAKVLSDDVQVADGSTDDDQEIVDYYTYSAAQGSASAAVAVGKLHWLGARGLDRDVHAAADYFEQAAAAGSPDGMAHLGHLHAQGDEQAGFPVNTTAAVEWYEKGIEAGSVAAMNGLGYLYLNGDGVDVDEEKAFKYISQAASAGNPDAQLNLGSLYFNGVGTPDGMPDYKRSYSLLASAAHQGRTLATYYLGLLHSQGLGTTRSCASALSLFKTVTERALQEKVMKEAHALYEEDEVADALLTYLVLGAQGLNSAQRNAAYILLHDADDERVLEMFDNDPKRVQDARLMMLAYSALQGNVAANIALGDHFFETASSASASSSSVAISDSGSNPYELALAQYRTGADRGHPQAMFNLGYMHQHGLGLPLDHHLAKRFYDQAWHTSPDAALPVALALGGLYLHSFADQVEERVGYPLEVVVVVVLAALLGLLGGLRVYVGRQVASLTRQRNQARTARRRARARRNRRH